MIKSREDLKAYVIADEKARGIHGKSYLKKYVFTYEARYQLILRLCEYYHNTGKGIGKILYLYYKYRRKMLGMKLGYSIPINTCGPGLCLVHAGPIVISQYARIGANCRIHICVNIGASDSKQGAPVLGEHVYIGPGAKLYGPITIGNYIGVGANAVVNRSFEQDHINIGGVPASIISDKGSDGIFEALEAEYNQMNQ